MYFKVNHNEEDVNVVIEDHFEESETDIAKKAAEHFIEHNNISFFDLINESKFIFFNKEDKDYFFDASLLFAQQENISISLSEQKYQLLNYLTQDNVNYFIQHCDFICNDNQDNLSELLFLDFLEKQIIEDIKKDLSDRKVLSFSYEDIYFGEDTLLALSHFDVQQVFPVLKEQLSELEIFEHNFKFGNEALADLLLEENIQLNFINKSSKDEKIVNDLTLRDFFILMKEREIHLLDLDGNKVSFSLKDFDVKFVSFPTLSLDYKLEKDKENNLNLNNQSFKDFKDFKI